MVEETLDQPEDGAFNDESDCELRQTDLAMLGLWRLSVIDLPPDRIEDLLAEETRYERSKDADWDEYELHRDPLPVPDAVKTLSMREDGWG